MMRTLIRSLAVTACAVLIPAIAAPAGLSPALASVQGSTHGRMPTPGAAGIGDPYFPTDGNGGYDVTHYDLAVEYQPSTDRLTGVAGINARATQALSAFNLDLDGLTVRSVRVAGRAASWTRAGTELTITPSRPIAKGSRFSTVIRYDGIPRTLGDPQLGVEGFIHTDDGAMVIGEPHVAATWFPVNDHPRDKASYDIKVTVPAGLQAVANGTLCGTRTHNGKTTWFWRAREPMASYLATASVGKFALKSYRADGISFVDAIDPDLFAPIAAPTTGEHFLYSQRADSSYKRLTRTISVPAAGAQLSYWVTRDTEQLWDFTFVEARTAGGDDWTTLPDLNGHTSNGVGRSCPRWLHLHPFLAHYQTDNGDGTCSPAGTSGAWSAATGKSDGSEQWKIDLTPYAGRDVEVSISYASDDSVQTNGVVVDDIAVSTGEGSTSFEDDGDVLDGWTVTGAPPGSPPNDGDWSVASTADLPPSTGAIIQGSFAREPEIIDFLSQSFGRYPFTAAGGIVDDLQGVGFALENQTRPIYSRVFFTDPISGDNVVVHELAHQWFGDSVSVHGWQDIWLNEGFATYAEWLWSEYENLGTVQDNFDFFYALVPPDNPLWSVTIGDPGPDHIFDQAVYWRGGMTLQQLRLSIGDGDFFRLLRTWARSHAGGNGTTAQFIALAERISGQDLDALFHTWLYTPGRPDLPAAAAAQTGRAVSGQVPAAALATVKRTGIVQTLPRR